MKITIQNGTLTYTKIGVTGHPNGITQSLDIKKPQEIDRVPGATRYYICVGEQLQQTVFWFSISTTGVITLAPECGNYLTVDQKTITINGAPISLVLSDLALPVRKFKKLGDIARLASQTINLLPCEYHLVSSDGNADFLCFSVNLAGNIEYDAAYQTVYAGNGTSTLTICGVVLEVDAKRLEPAQMLIILRVDDGGTRYDLGSKEGAFAGTLLPGHYVVRNAFQGSSSSTIVDEFFAQFEVTSSGHIESTDLTLKIDGSHIEVLGSEVTLDASALSYPNFYVDSFRLAGNAEKWLTKDPKTIRVLPGYLGIRAGSAETTEGYPAYIECRVNRTGSFYYEDTYEKKEVLKGRGTRTLFLRGFQVTLDATALTPQTMRMRGVQAIANSTDKKVELQLLGMSRYDSNHGLDFSSTTVLGLALDPRTATIYRDASTQWPTIAGWNTASLTIYGAAVEFDLRAFQSVATTFVIRPKGHTESWGPFHTIQICKLRLFPGDYLLQVATDSETPTSSSQKLKGLTVEFKIDTDGKFTLTAPTLREPVAKLEESLDDKGIKQTKVRLGVIESRPTPDWPIANGLPEGIYTATLAVTSNQNWTSERVVKRVVVKK